MSKFLHHDPGTGGALWLDYPTSAVRKTNAKYPFDCYALGVHQSQIPELRKKLDGNGCRAVDISRDGDPIITGSREYVRVRKALGFHQLNSFVSH